MKLHELHDVDDVDDGFEEFKTEFAGFMKGKVRNMWLYGGNNIAAYIRKGHHLIDNKIQSTLDIANIKVEDRGKGTGMTLIYWIHQQNPFNVTLVESILNERLYARLKKDGWQDVPNSDPPSVYLPKN